MRPEVFDEWVRGRTCESCAIFDKDVFCFVLAWSLQEDIEKSDVANYYLVHNRADPDKDFGVEFKGDSGRRLAVNHGETELIMVAHGGNVLRHNRQGGKSEKMLSQEQIRGAESIRFIGEHFYLAGGIRRVLRRDGPENWVDVANEVPHDLRPGVSSLALGFQDIDGFDEQDILAVGGHGDVWHFDGTAWTPVDIPTDSEISSVCCAADGFVYLGGNNHRVVRGRGDTWEIIHEDESNRIFEQIVDYEGRVLAVDEWGSSIFEITSVGIAPMDIGDYAFPPTGCRCLATGHGMLLAAGAESASLFDGTRWQSLFRSPEADDAMLADMLLQDTKAAVAKLADDLDKLDDQ